MRRPRKRCYECGRRVATDGASCPQCGAVLQTYCGCGAHVSVFDRSCPLCDAALTPREYRPDRRRLRILIPVILAAAAVYGLYVFMFRAPEDLRGEALQEVVRSFERGSNTEKTVRLIESYHRRFGEETKTRLLLARCRFRQGKIEESRRLLADLLADDRENAAVQEALADCLLALGRRHEAEELARSMAESHPDSGAYHLRLADLRERDGDLKGAITSVRNALACADAPPESEMRLAGLLLDAGLTGEGLRHMAKAAREGVGGRTAVTRICVTLALTPEIEDEAVLEEAQQALRALTDAGEFDAVPGAPPSTALEARVGLALGGGECRRVRDLLLEARTSRPLTGEERLLLARALTGTDQADEAIPLLDALEAECLEEPDDASRVTRRTEIAAAWLEAGRPRCALAVLGPATATDPVLLRVLVRARWWLIAAEPPASPEAVASVIEVLADSQRLLELRPRDETAAAAVTLARTILARTDEQLMGGEPAVTLPRQKMLAGRERSTLRDLYRRRAGRDPDARARALIRKALWGRSLQRDHSGESPDLVRAGSRALEAGLMAMFGEITTAASMARGAGFEESDLGDRCLAARVLAGFGRPAAALDLLAQLATGPQGGYRAIGRGDLLRSLDRPREARLLYETAAAGAGDVALAALMRLGEMAAESEPAELPSVLHRIRALGPR